jgi:hypothetical protein
MDMIVDYNANQATISPAELVNRINESYKEKDTDKDQLVSDTVATPASKSLPRKKHKGTKMSIATIYEGIHNFNSKTQPQIERFIRMDEYSKYFIESSIKEMRTVPIIPETGEVGFRVVS